MMAKAKTMSKALQSLEKKNACFVVITCSGPEDDGKMQVEMNYEGDPVLASYLLESAQHTIGEDIENSSIG